MSLLKKNRANIPQKPEKKRQRRFFAFLSSCFLLFICLLSIVGIFSRLPGVGCTASPQLSPTSTSYHVQGKIILDDQGKQYIPYGVHSTALFEPDWKNSIDYKNFNIGQIQAAHTIWHANVMSFQVAWANLFPDHNNFNAPDPTYLQAMDQAVTWTTQEDMNVIFGLQSEASTNEIMATEASVYFWQIVANRYKDNPRVFFDVFNEPRDFYDWNLWQSGGQYNGVKYVGMQQLVNTIRNTGAQNLIFVQGQGAGESFDYDNFRDHLLSGENIIYAIHPYLSEQQHLTQNDWETWWGRSVRNLNVPFVIGEWNLTLGSGCIRQGPSVALNFLNYVQQLNIGLIAWALTPGSLIRGSANPDAPWNWANPTAFDTQSLTCVDNLTYPYHDPHSQGAGRLIINFLATHAPLQFNEQPTSTVNQPVSTVNQPTPAMRHNPVVVPTLMEGQRIQDAKSSRRVYKRC